LSRLPAAVYKYSPLKFLESQSGRGYGRINERTDSGHDFC
jgi:hypothetical protein